jgi:Ca2+-transporting ATPase
MSDPRPNDEPGQSSTLRRGRAPTITIDTSAVNSPDSDHPPIQVLSGGSRTYTDNATAPDTTALLSNGSVSPTDMRSTASIRSNAFSEARDRESRPTSPQDEGARDTFKLPFCPRHTLPR